MVFPILPIPIHNMRGISTGRGFYNRPNRLGGSDHGTFTFKSPWYNPWGNPIIQETPAPSFDGIPKRRRSLGLHWGLNPWF